MRSPKAKGFQLHSQSAPSKATDEGKEGQQDEIHLFGLRAERMVKGQRWSLLARWINLSSGKRQEPKLAVCAQPQALHGPCAERERGPALELPLRRPMLNNRESTQHSDNSVAGQTAMAK
jgi:hypothetical protein